MSDTRITPETGHVGLTGYPAEMVMRRAAETWQFFAFVFAALATIALSLLDEIPDRYQPWRIALKIVAFVGLGYLLLLNVRVRGWLSILLVRFKEERS